jgi:putative ABC transport system permease protein
MNIVNKLTLRHLKLNKRRTLVTVIGVIISAAMIMGVATISTSFLHLLIRETIAHSGEWHVLYREVNKEQLEAIRQDKATKTLIVSRDIGYAEAANATSLYKPYLFIKSYNDEGFRHFSVELSEGRLPQTGEELAVSETFIADTNASYKIGDTVTLDVGRRYLPEDSGFDVSRNGQYNQSDALFLDENGKPVEELRDLQSKTYTIVGIIKQPAWEPAWSPGYTALTFLDETRLGPEERANGSVILRKVNNGLYKHAEALAERLGTGRPVFNSELLRYYGVTDHDNLRTTLYSITGVLMLVIVIGSVSLIYNAFSISVSERARHLGMLASVGATRRQKRNSVFFEGLVISLISIPLGIAAGVAGIAVTFLYISRILQDVTGLSEPLRVVVTWGSVAAACGLSLLTIFISTYLPAVRASKVSAIDAIRQTADIKLTGKTVKTSKLVRKLFGIEAEIGLKNLKRHKRRYTATVFSLVISIVLFLTVSFFTDDMRKSVRMSQDVHNYDLVIRSGSSEGFRQSFLEDVAALPDVTDYTVIKQADLYTRLEEAQLSDPMKQRAADNPDLLEDGKMRQMVNLYGLDEDSFRKFAEQIGANVDRLRNADQPAAIVIDTVTYMDDVQGKYVEAAAIHAKAGDRLELETEPAATGEPAFVGSVEIAALTKQTPIGVIARSPGILNVVLLDRVLLQLLESGPADAANLIERMNLNSGMYLLSSDPMQTQKDIEAMEEDSIYMSNVYQSRQQGQQMIFIISVFTYGFILLITAISIANIFNTISTSVALRKREFAMLKSVGMTPGSFNKMLNYESIFYGLKALLYGLPISLAVMVWIHQSMGHTFSYRFEPPWLSMVIVFIAVFLIVGSSMLYSSAKVKKENIIDAIKQESI